MWFEREENGLRYRLREGESCETDRRRVVDLKYKCNF